MIGILAIEMSGGVYCPLSPRDPQHRLQSLLKQMQSRFVLVHHFTKTMFRMNVVSADMDSIITSKDIGNDNDIELLTTILVTLDDVAYIIFTSGSTGIPKAVSDEIYIIYINDNVFLTFIGSSATTKSYGICTIAEPYWCMY